MLPTAEARADWRQWGSGEMRWHGILRSTVPRSTSRGREPGRRVGKWGATIRLMIRHSRSRSSTGETSPAPASSKQRGRDAPPRRSRQRSATLGGQMKRLFPDVRNGATQSPASSCRRSRRPLLPLNRALGEIADVDSRDASSPSGSIRAPPPRLYVRPCWTAAGLRVPRCRPGRWLATGCGLPLAMAACWSCPCATLYADAGINLALSVDCCWPPARRCRHRSVARRVGRPHAAQPPA